MKLNLTLLRRAILLLGMTMVVSSVSATDVPKNLGNDLDKLVESNIALKKAHQANTAIPTYNGFASERAALASDMAIREESTGKYLVDIHPNGRFSYDQLKGDLLKTCHSLRITAQDQTYKGVGLIEGFISIDEVAKVANNKGVNSVQLGIKPYVRRSKNNAGMTPSAVAFTQVGSCFDQGVTQHRIDRISTIYNPSATMSLDGAGISVACLSDSYDTNTGAITHAANDVAADNLPGRAGNPYNANPVFVLHDDTGVATDEARALCQVAYKMAPRAKIGVSTANGGELNFANSIRALAGINSADFPNASTQGYAANVICDDVGYFDEPWYERGIIGAAVDDVAITKNVAYFSSASNDIGTNAYTSALRWIANGTGVTFTGGNVALVNTNIDLTGVPVELYQGGFHNFNPTPGQTDVALTWALPAGGQLFVMQWDDPYDQDTSAILDPVLYHNSGVHSGTTITFTVPNVLTAGQLYECDVTQTSGDFDAIVTITDPSNNVIVDHQDTTIDEVVRFFAPVTGGNYHILVDRFAATTGGFDVDLYHASGFVGGPLVTTDINLLAFNSSGAYVPASSIKANNFATNQPIELAQIVRANAAGLQFLVARRNVPSSGGPTHFRIEDGGNGIGGIAPCEYFTYNTVTTGGHNTASMGNGVGAYSVFPPNRPETFTSPGPAIYYFNNDNSRKATPEVRLQPRISAADGANTSFFAGSDSTSDVDTNRNFSGTSASSPHAAGIAALVLQAKGGPGSVSPAQMTNLLENSAYPHDLDPMFVKGTATASDGGTVTITCNSDASSIAGIFGLTTGVGLADKNSWKVTYNGPAGSFVTDLTFNPTGSAAAAGSPTSGQNGVDGSLNYFRTITPGIVFEPAVANGAFATGTLTGLTASDISAPVFSNLAPAPSNGTNQYWTMALAFPNSNFTTAKGFNFTVGRGQQHNSALGAGATTVEATADILGGSILIPENTGNGTGMAFSGHINDGGSLAFAGTLNNIIGAGYSVLDGYGFINAEAAATASLTIPSAVTVSSVLSRFTHAGSGTFDVNITSGTATECRDGGTAGNYTMVFTATNPLTSVAGAVLSEGSGSVSNVAVAGNTATVSLTGVPNAQRVTVNLLDVRDNAGNVSQVVSGTMRLLIGDTTNNGSVNAGDVSQTKIQVGALVGAGNFRQDVNHNGSINAGDVSNVKIHVGTSVP